MDYTLDFNSINALILDIDGTLWRGQQALPGLIELFRFIHKHNLSFRVVTNNTVKTPAHYRQRLAAYGVPVQLESVLTASVATAQHLSREFGPKTVLYVIGEAGLLQVLRRAGLKLSVDVQQPADVVVVGGDRQLTYEKLKQAVLLVRQGAAFIGTNPDLLVPTEEGLVPEAGATLAAIQAATGVQPTIIGKPERYLFDLALTGMDASPGRSVMVGDRLETDILGGQRLGLKTVLVTTGVDNEQTLVEKNIRPDAVFSNLIELVNVWQGHDQQQDEWPMTKDEGI